jgi:phosphoribosylformylglycinamidine synthase
MLAALSEIIPGAETWPRFETNASEQFEARLVSVRVNESPSIFFSGMSGSVLSIPVAHGEGRAQFQDEDSIKAAFDAKLVPLQYVDNNHHLAERYPSNPNGSARAVACLTSEDGRFTILMPHPERAFMSRQLPRAAGAGPYSGWLRFFENARTWIDART